MRYSKTSLAALVACLFPIALSTQALAGAAYSQYPMAGSTQIQIDITGQDAQNLYSALSGPELIGDGCDVIYKLGESLTCYRYPKATPAKQYGCSSTGDAASGKLVSPMQAMKDRLRPASECVSPAVH